MDAFLKQGAPLFHIAVNKTIVQKTAAPICLPLVFQPNEVLFCPTISLIPLSELRIHRNKKMANENALNHTMIVRLQPKSVTVN